MDSYPTLISPIDSFSFSHFSSPSSSHDTSNKSNNSTPSGQGQFPHTPSPLKHNTEWQELLQGPPGGQFPFSYWDSNSFTQRQASPSPWRPSILRSLSDTFVDSPASSSLSLTSSSATGSPALFGTSATCSPWETCPGLQPSPDIPFLDELDLSGGLGNGFPSTLNFGPGDETSTAFGGLSLNSPPTQTGSSLRSPILLPYEPFEQVDPSIIHDSGMMHSYSLLPPGVHPGSSTIEPSHLNISNALALDFADIPAASDQGPVTAQAHSVPFAPFGGPVGPIQNIPAQSNRSSPPSSYTDAIHIPPPPRSGSAPALTGGSSADMFSFPTSAGFPSEGPLHSRSTRRKTSRVNYSEAFGGESDGDDEYIGDHPMRDQSGRIVKRRKAGGNAAFTLSESDSESGSSASCDDAPRRGRKPGLAGRRAVSMSAASNKRKCKRRHSCIRPGCGATFTRVTDMERHVSSVHREGDTDANRCSFCRKAFSREDAVLRHENDSCPMRPRKKAATPAERWS